MKVSELRVGDELEDYRRGRHLVVTAIDWFSGGSGGGNGEIAYDVVVQVGLVRSVLRKERKTWREFERLKFIRCWGDRR